ncbi:hypothetical protein [Thioalkalivibrio sp. ALE19]|uniref:hypothetical protein n=1 Tax=Thioalkalivibrio sp. ALE19 TaxID=1266909 RepID=UPI000408DCD9|nr:hypothetical protein [Thioalkalivibrio sp. ALE19]
MSETETLYDRLGGQAGIDKLVNRIVELHLQNQTVGPRYWALDDIVQAMQEMDYPRPVCDEVLGISYSLKEEIVHK